MHLAPVLCGWAKVGKWCSTADLGGRNSGEKVPFLGACRRKGRSSLTGTQEWTLGANMRGESAYPPPLRPTGGSLVGSLQQTGNYPNGLTGTPLISCLLVFCPFMSSLSFPMNCSDSHFHMPSPTCSFFWFLAQPVSVPPPTLLVATA